ncbi:MAG TPA: Smr/MutS family protein [Caulobacteraceae bacterium]|nr:Smr/MutS family protein [Caulobacteraceae bacterium]
MKRHPRPDEVRLWSRVASTVHPMAGKTAPEGETAPAPVQQPLPVKAPPKKATRQTPPSEIEPNRLHRIGREHLEARLDLHGLDQDRARATLEAFLRRVWDEGYRSALIITGKGMRGEGVLRKMTPEWLAAPSLREIVAGVSTAKRQHGGEGALYVALKRKPRP